MRPLESFHALLIGVGAIGARTAEVSAALDMRVIGVRRHGG